MKCLIASALALLASLGWFGLQPEASAGAASCPLATGDCDVTVEPQPDGTCLIECEGPEGACWMVVECDEDGECTIVDRGGIDCPLEDCAPEDCLPMDCAPVDCGPADCATKAAGQAEAGAPEGCPKTSERACESAASPTPACDGARACSKP